MATGAQPYHDMHLENSTFNMRLIFQLGLGRVAHPTIPTQKLGIEGIEFLEAIFLRNPTARPCASDLFLFDFLSSFVYEHRPRIHGRASNCLCGCMS